MMREELSMIEPDASFSPTQIGMVSLSALLLFGVVPILLYFLCNLSGSLVGGANGKVMPYRHVKSWSNAYI